MAKNAYVQARVEQQLKEKAEDILSRLGLSITDAVTVYYRQIVLQRGLPFPVKIPNRITRRAMEDAAAGKDVVRCKDKDELFKSLGL